MSAAFKLISINIEGNKHLPRIRAFLEAEKPGIVCLQELSEESIPFFEELLGASCVFAPMTSVQNTNGKRVIGVGIFSRLAVQESTVEYYVDHLTPEVNFDKSSFETKFATASFAVAAVTVLVDTVPFTVLSTHFPVTDGGEATDFQREALASLLSTLEKYDSFVLCGDFNAPRGREIFSSLASRYIDNVPSQYTSSLDPDLHRAAPLELMVDGLFTTVDIAAENVSMRCGVSDHCALVATVTKR